MLGRPHLFCWRDRYGGVDNSLLSGLNPCVQQPAERALHLASRATELDVKRAGAVVRRPTTKTHKKDNKL
jgi:hypothetical protein